MSPSDYPHIDALDSRLRDVEMAAAVLTQRVTSNEKHFVDYSVSVEKSVTSALKSVTVATEKAESSQRRINEGQNEFRGALKDQAGLLASKEQVAALEQRIQMLEKAGASGQGRSSITTLLWGLAGAIAVAVIVYVITHGLPR